MDTSHWIHLIGYKKIVFFIKKKGVNYFNSVYNLGFKITNLAIGYKTLTWIQNFNLVFGYKTLTWYVDFGYKTFTWYVDKKLKLGIWIKKTLTWYLDKKNFNLVFGYKTLTWYLDTKL